MTEHVHEWRFDIRTIPGIIECAFVCDCGEEILGLDVLRRLNAAEMLNWQRADAIVGALMGEYEIEDADVDAVQAYADTLEGK